MITVNLIPKEILRKERTPIGQFAAILLGVLAVVGSIAAYLYIEFGRLAEVESELKKVTAELEVERPYQMYADRLLKEKLEYARRTETIQGIGSARVLWSKKLDQLWEVVQNNGDAERHNVWLTSLNAKSPGKGTGKRQTAGMVSLAGYSATDQSKKLSNFHRDLTESPYFEDFYEINDPEGSVTYFKDDKEPKAAWRFNFQMKMKSAAEAKKAKGRKPAVKKNTKKK
jgi:Tfp pilus assembly protein PilN